MRKIVAIFLLVLTINSPAAAANIDNWRATIDKWLPYALAEQQHGQVPGWSVAVVVDGQIVYSQGFGKRDIDSGASVNANTVFPIASLSKAFTTALMAQAVDRGQIAWDSKVNQILPQFRFYDKNATANATITDLFAQRSGLKTYVGDIQANLGFSRGHIVQSFAYIKPQTAFRSQYNYQNCLFLVGAAIEEQLSGQSWDKLVRDQLFIPLNMTATSASKWGYKNAKNHATLYQINGDDLQALTSDRYLDWIYTLAPAAGINSSANDMAQWLTMQLNNGKYNDKQLISAANIGAMRQPQTAMGKTLMGDNSYYCLGWIYTPAQPYPIYWHNGGSSGSSSTIMLIPELNAGIIILANLNGHFPYIAARQFYDVLTGHNPQQVRQTLEAMGGSGDWSPDSYDSSNPPSLSLASYAGKYDNPVYGPIVLQYNDGILQGYWGANKTAVNLRHLDGDIFALDCQLAYAVDEPISFKVNNGIVTGFSMKCFRDEGTDWFTRK